MTYTYYGDGSRHTMVEGVGTTTYSYDNAQRLTSLVNPYSETTTWDYDAADRCTKQTFDTGFYTSFGYDTRDRLTSLTHKNSSNSTISSESYVYDDASNLYTKTVDGTTTTYGYDNADQLTSESRSGYSASYTYDANGNRATKTLGGTTDTYHNNNVDELTYISVGGVTTKSYTYDDAGRTKTVVVGGNTTSLDYDYEGRLTQITYPSTATNTFTYNALDARVGKVDSAGTFAYKRDGANPVDSLLSDGVAAFTPSVSERRSGTTKFYERDNMWSISRITNTSQATTDTRQSDAFGLQLASTGSTATPFGFGGGWGYQCDTDSGLLLSGCRYYDPASGRFLTRDPADYGRNGYAYCNNRPTVAVDPTGKVMAVVVASVLVGNDESSEDDGWLDRFLHLGGKGGNNKGRGDDPFYNLDRDALADKARNGTPGEKKRAIRIQKEKGWRGRANDSNFGAMPPVIDPITVPRVIPIVPPAVPEFGLPTFPFIIFKRLLPPELWGDPVA